MRKRAYEWLRERPGLLGVIQPVYRGLRKLVIELPLAWSFRLRARLHPVRGVRDEPGSPPVLVSLTSFGERLEDVSVCIETLLRQDERPDRIILWVAEEDFAKGLSAGLLHQQKRGLDIRTCPDLRSYKKIIPALAEFSDHIIVTADDDVFYPRTWLARLMDAYRADPEVVHCHRSYVMTRKDDGGFEPYFDWPDGNTIAEETSFRVFPVGVGGVLYPPGCFDERVTDRALFEELSPSTDDIWLKAMTLLKGVKCRQTSDFPKPWIALPGTLESGLYQENVYEGQNDRNLRRVFDHFDLFRLFEDRKPEP